MKIIICIIILTFLNGCSATKDEKTLEIKNAVDTTQNNISVEDFWVLSHQDYPKYPVNAARDNISGCVDFRFIIDREGRATNIQVIKAIPHRAFIPSATESLKKFRWEPTENNSTHQPVVTTLQLEFIINRIRNVPECLVKGTT
ncbi:energy transducer TonB [Alteromonas pelagimontana]|uniref:Energy transducer TonB n=1 Tax=Alteromonas pelagimontana TaxID=1858656 RepID=A0A6M4MC62_9ALTE|nr:energy transducer TonB [Alteromonas pelagimontana]QJR79746.1 energy transducer TonB [Alteromonas pelagimontana]